MILEHPYEDSEEENNAQPDPIHKALERKFEASVDNQTPKSTTKSKNPYNLLSIILIFNQDWFIKILGQRFLMMN